jgi:hypothetical protein
MQTNISGLRASGVIALASVLQACGDPKSSSTGGPNGGVVPTSQMTIDLKVESKDPSSAVVRANLNDGKALGSSFRLDGGDFFRACINGVCKSMADNDSLDSPDYIARFTFQPGVDYVVSFNRQEGQNAPDSRVILPQPFTLVTPADRTQVTYGQSVIFEWTPTGAPARVSLDYTVSCALTSGSSTSNGKLGTDTNSDGREVVRIDSIMNAMRSTGQITQCDIDVSVHHELSGRVDRAFRGGTAVGIVTRTARLVFIPS